jgi:hypothetical protein
LLSNVEIGGKVILFWLETGMNNRGRLKAGDAFAEGEGGYDASPGGEVSSRLISQSSE